MFIAFLALIFLRPFIASLAFPYLNTIYSVILMELLLVKIFLDIKNQTFNTTTFIALKPPLLAWISFLMLSVIFSKNKLVSVCHIYTYITSILLFISALIFSKKQQLLFCQTMIVSAVFVCALALYQYFFGFRHLLNYVSQNKINNPFLMDYISHKRVFSPFVTPNSLAGYLIMIFPLVLLLKKNGAFGFEILQYATLLILTITLFLTKSLGAIICLVLILCYYIELNKSTTKKLRLILFITLLLVIVFILFLRIHSQEPHISPILSAERRLAYWKASLQLIKTAFFTGVGLGNFNMPQSRYSHNSYLQILAETGILGLLSFLWLILSSLKKAFKNFKFSVNKEKQFILALLLANISFLSHNLIDFTFFLPEIAWIWWIILGLHFSQDSNTAS